VIHRGVVALAQPVQVHRPREVGRGGEVVHLLAHQQRVGAQVDELAARHQLGRDQVRLRVDERLAVGDRHHRRAALLHRGDRGLHAHPLPEDVRRVLDLPAAHTGQVAGEQRLQLDDQRELLPPGELLPGQVGADPQVLAQRHSHRNLTSAARPAGRAV
jgi:hypothetical protein